MAGQSKSTTLKDPLFAGLARDARIFGLPIAIASIFMVAAVVVVLFTKALEMTRYGFLFLGLSYVVLVTATYNEDRGVNYIYDWLKRRSKNGRRAFRGISYESAYRFSKGSHFAFAADVEKENMETEKLPWLHHITPEVIKTVTGDLMTTLRLEGLNYATESYDDLAILKKHRANIYRQLPSRFVVYIHYVRRETRPERHPDIDNDFFNDFETQYLAQQQESKVFRNDIYITLVARHKNPNNPPWIKLKEALFLQSGADEKLLAELDAAKQLFKQALADANPYELTTRTRNGVPVSEPLTFLSGILNADETPVPVLNEEIRDYLGISRRVFKENGHIRFNLPNGMAKMGVVFGLPNRTYPEDTDHRMIDRFLTIDHELVLCESFQMMDRQNSMKLADRRKNQLQNTKDKSESQIKAIKESLDDLAAGRMINGIFNFNVLALADNLADFKDVMKKVPEAFTAVHMIPKLEDIIAEPSFYAMLPGNMHFIQRPAIINTTNFAGFGSLHNTRIGKKKGNHWGEYIIRLKTTSNTPYYFNFHDGDVGHTRFIAPTGGGKTTALNAFLAASLKHDPYIFHFDFEYSAAVFFKAIDGQHIILSPQLPTGWNPLQLDDTAANRDFLARWLGFIGARRNEDGTLKPLLAVEESKIKEVIEQIYSFPRNLRRLGEFAPLFGVPEQGSLAEAIQRWCGNGALANFFDNDDDAFSLEGSKRFCFEMKNIINNKDALVAATMYIMHRIDIAMMEAKPFIVVMEEGQRYVEDEYNRQWLKIMLTTYRRRNGMVVFVTPTPEVVTEDENLRQQFKTSIFLPNKKATADTYMSENGLFLTEKEYNWVKETNPRTAREILIKNDSDTVVASINLGNMPNIIDIFSGNEQKYNMLMNLTRGKGYTGYRQWRDAYEALVKPLRNQKEQNDDAKDEN